jgi:hypothetical protein
MAKELKDKLGFVAMQVRSWIDVLVLQADQHTKSMNEDYEYFFRWYSEDMYKIQVELFYYRELQREIKTDSLREVLSYLEGKVNEFEDELLVGGLRQHSTSSSTNLAHTLKLEAKQHLRKRFQRLIDNIK